ncbi:SHOCT domain-containing protein [Rhodococcus sp. 1168]|uniref:SHOCT domain-containing protein n=1 Tax=Rhodococcus sp. 1168 TaxID=2018041 RepID=UPI000A0E5579|nr:hypothetical protein [Rhodococcus sp. 1168]ORI13503.1 hypothetical protein BJI47_23005 [Rhodococcus sp. 1168]
MMYWYGNDPTGWGYALMIIGMVVFWGVLITGVLLLLRSQGARGSQQTHPPVLYTAEQLLAERFARGEIDEDDYRARLTTLRQQ